MSFISILKKIGEVAIGAEHFVAPIIETAYPALSGPVAALDGIFQRLQATVSTIEANNPADGQGKAKAPAAVADFNAGLEFAQQVLALEGKKLTYDPAKLDAAIAATVASFNSYADLKSTFKIEAL